MIATGNGEFRTLAQPIFVNGKKVREVWANGHMVYPEVGIGNFLKVRGVLSISKSFTRPQVGGLFKDTVNGYLISGSGTYIPEWNSYYAIRVVFVAIYRAKGWSLSVTDDWMPITTSRFNGNNYYGLLNPLAPAGEEEVSGDIDRVYGKKIVGSYSVRDFQCSIMSNAVPIQPKFVEESKGGGFIFDTPDSYSRADTIPDTPSILATTMWNNERLTSLNYSYPNSMYPDARLRVSALEDGGIALTMSGLTVLASKNYYGGSYFYDGYYSLQKTERVTLEIRSVGTFNVPVTDILYSGNESDAPEWAKTISDSDFIL